LRTSTGRVLWVIWCLAWAGFWLVAAVLSIPSSGCVLVANGTCQGRVSHGSWPAVGVSAALLALSVAAVRLPVGREHRD